MEIMGRVKGRQELSRRPRVVPYVLEGRSHTFFSGFSGWGVEDDWGTELGKEIAVGRERGMAPNDPSGVDSYLSLDVIESSIKEE